MNTGNTKSDFGGTFNCSEPQFPFWEAGIPTVSFPRVSHVMRDDWCQLISVVCVIKDRLHLAVLNYVSLLLVVGAPEALLEPLHFPVITRRC